MENANFTPENAGKFMCEKCDFKCSKKCDYERHLMTPKHQNATEMLQNATYFTPKNAVIFVCDKCCKKFKKCYHLNIENHQNQTKPQ